MGGHTKENWVVKEEDLAKLERNEMATVLSQTTRNLDIQLAFHGKEAWRPIVIFSIFSERLDRFG